MRPSRLLKSRFLILFTSLVSLVLNGTGNSHYWQIRDGKIQAFVTRQGLGKPMITQPRLSGDLDRDGIVEYLTLADGSAQITDYTSSLLWQSPQGWLVTEAQIGDLNRDGVDEAVLLVWRLFQPWPVDHFLPSGGRINNFHDKNGDSCQIILIGWTRDAWREIWAGSALVRPVEQVKVADLDGDGWQEVAALERPYDSKTSSNAITVWHWQGFGFTLTDRLEGSFRKLTIVSDDSQNWLATK